MKKETRNYLKDIFHCDNIRKLKPETVSAILGNIQFSEDVLDKEITQAYFKLHGLPEMNYEQFEARRESFKL